MKTQFLLSFWALLLLCSCGANKTETTSADSTSTITAANVKWFIPLSEPLGPSSGIILPTDPKGVPFYEGKNLDKVIEYIHDTLHVQVLEVIGKAQAPCDVLTEVYKVSIAGKNGWIAQTDLMRVELLNMGPATSGGLTVSAVRMRKNYKVDGNDCVPVQALFLYDEKNLYLINPTMLRNESLHWYTEKHLSLVDPRDDAGAITSETDEANNIITYQWAIVPNTLIKLSVSYRLNHFLALNYEIGPLDGDVVDSGEGEVITKSCSFSYIGAGDCGHIEFDCGDFGNAITEGLAKEDAELWGALGIDESGAEESDGNPEYLGKTFEIKYILVDGEVCGAPDQDGNYYSTGKVEKLLSFKLAQE